ncbi:MAG: hypothetical protein ACOY94_22960 [Bacillota bacterium]
MAEKQYDADGEWDFADEGPDTSAMQEVAGRFADGLHAVPAAPMTLDLGVAKVRAIPGITSTS